MDEAKLIEKLRLIEALFAGAGTEGERVAAGRARERILKRMREVEAEDPPIEYRFSMGDMWSKRVFLALLRRYDLTPYRYWKQRRTTVMVRVSRRFVDETLWPQFQQINGELRAYLSDITTRVVSQVLSDDMSDASVVREPPRLPGHEGEGKYEAPAATPVDVETAAEDSKGEEPPGKASASRASAPGSKRGRKSRKKRRKQKKRKR